MEKIKDLIRKISISSSSTVEEAVNLMKKHRVTGLAVVDEGVLVGVLSGRDILKPLISSKYHNSEVGLVDQFMVREPKVIEDNVGFNDIIQSFVDKPMHYYPVVKVTESGLLFLGTAYRIDMVEYVSSLEKTTW